MIVSVDKPKGMTSHDVVDEVRRVTGEKRVGHGGTLDPLATGVLVIGITRESTKKLHNILRNASKEYEATLMLGKTSTTGDTEGEIEETATESEVSSVTKAQVEKTLKTFEGEIKQVPPSHSAVKVGGTPAYKKARKGEEVELAPRTATIHEIKLLKFEPPILILSATVSAGTYIRSLAGDIGEKLGVGAYLVGLVRTRAGEFTLEKSPTLTELKKQLGERYNP